MKPLLLILPLALSSCTNIGQQITNKNGTIAINQTPQLPQSAHIKVQNNQPEPSQQPSKKEPELTYKTSYESKQIIGSYIVIQ